MGVASYLFLNVKPYLFVYTVDDFSGYVYVEFYEAFICDCQTNSTYWNNCKQILLR